MALKKVMVFGTFDIVHPGHLFFFKRAKRYGSFLIVVVARDVNVCQFKNPPLNNESIRFKNLKKIKIINQVILGDLKEKLKPIMTYKPEVICLGYDQPVIILELIKKLKKFSLRPKIFRLKSFQPKKYKSSLIKKINAGH